MNTKNTLPWLVLLFLASQFVMWGCASQKRISSKQAEIDNLRRELKFYKEQNSQFRRELNDLEKRIAELELADRQINADVTAQVDEVRQQLEAIQNLLQDTNYRINDLSRLGPKQQRPNLAMPSEKSQDDSLASEQQPPSQLSSLDSARELYNTAYRDLIRGNYQLALHGFRQFLQQYPNSDLADNAQYWTGEVFYAQGRYSNAIEEFEKVVRWYRNGDKTASALLKIGFAYLNIDEIEQGKLYLQEVIQQHPNSEEASLAKGRLASLN
ncbi:MAG: tol-pal system protein YbgF [bacterium]